MLIPHRRFTPLVAPVDALREWLCHPAARGGAVAAFEAAVAARLGIPHVIATSSARVALSAALTALGAAPGDEIWLAANSYDGLMPHIRATGLVPRPVDVGADFNIAPQTLAVALSGRPRRPGFLLATHMYGLPCDVVALRALAERHGLVLIEDCAHTFDVDVGTGVRAGGTGRAGIFSFQARKNINMLTGGAVVTTDAGLAARVRAIVAAGGGQAPRVWTQLATYALEQHVFFAPWGYSLTRQVFELAPVFRFARRQYGRVARFNRSTATAPSGLQARLALAQVARFDERRARLDARWRDYDAALAQCPGLTKAPSRPAPVGHGRYMYVIGAPSPAALARALWRRGVGTARGAGLVPCIDESALATFPTLLTLRRHALQLPFSAAMSDAAFAHVARALVAAWQEVRP